MDSAWPHRSTWNWCYNSLPKSMRRVTTKTTEKENNKKIKPMSREEQRGGGGQEEEERRRRRGGGDIESRTHSEWTLQTEDLREISSRFCFTKLHMRNKNKTNAWDARKRKCAGRADGTQVMSRCLHTCPLQYSMYTKYKTQTMVTL